VRTQAGRAVQTVRLSQKQIQDVAAFVTQRITNK